VTGKSQKKHEIPGFRGFPKFLFFAIGSPKSHAVVYRQVSGIIISLGGLVGKVRIVKVKKNKEL
jgi:hypothetical protein